MSEVQEPIAARAGRAAGRLAASGMWLAPALAWIACIWALQDHQLSGVPYWLAVSAQVAISPAAIVYLLGLIWPRLRRP